MNRFTSWFTSTYHGSNRLSLWFRKKFEGAPVRQILGIHLAGVTFFSAVVLPQTGDLLSNIEVLRETQQTVIEVVPTEAKIQWPLPRFGLSQQFSLVHPGIDLTAPAGTPVFSVTSGWVAWTNSALWGYGKHLLIEHDKGTRSLYAHLSKINVSPGQTIIPKTPIGEVGSTGWATGNHLHLEIYKDGTPVNPLEVLPAIN